MIERGTLPELLKRAGVLSSMWREFAGAQSDLEAVV
jgi:hypothetical protein